MLKFVSSRVQGTVSKFQFQNEFSKHALARSRRACMAQPSNRSSCLDPVRDRESFARRRGVRLAVLTFASRDLVAQCHLFMRFYIHVERIPIADIHVLMNEASDEIRGCFGEYPLPRKNIIDLTQPGVQRARNATGARYREQHRSRALMQKQRELLNGGYSHTLLADLDEFVMAAPDKYSSLYDYLQQNPHRRTAAPRHAYEVQVVEAEEPPLNWTAAPLLRGQRSVMVPVCGMRKPILSRVPSHFTFSTHNMKMPLFFACSPNKWGSTFDCLDDALWLIHTKVCQRVRLAGHPKAL